MFNRVVSAGITNKRGVGETPPPGRDVIKERRESPRMPMAFDVVLNHHDQVIVGTLRDISMNGAFICAEPDILPYAGTVEIGFSVPVNGEAKYFRMQATIRRVTQAGTGISFGDVGREAYFNLVDLYTATARVA